jgi:hypothetical protein
VRDKWARHMNMLKRRGLPSRADSHILQFCSCLRAGVYLSEARNCCRGPGVGESRNEILILVVCERGRKVPAKLDMTETEVNIT